MSTVTIEIASDVAEDKFDCWLEVSSYCISGTFVTGSAKTLHIHVFYTSSQKQL